MAIQKVHTSRGIRWKSWYGRNSPKRTWDTRGQAIEYEDAEKKKRLRERAGMELEREAITYDALCELFLANDTSKSHDWTTRMLAYSREAFGKEYVRSLRPEGIGAWLNRLTLADKTKSHILERMRRVFDAGVEWGYLNRSPARPGAVKSPGQSRVRPIAPFESWQDVCAVADAMKHMKHGALVRFACATGLRPGEWRSLTWGMLDLDRKQMSVPGTKTENAARIIPLSQLALDAIAELPRGLPHVKVFDVGDYAGWRRNHWHPAVTLAGFEKRTPHEMRHTFATLALASRVPIDVVSKLLGHSSIEITLRYYAKYVPSTLADQLSAMDELGKEGEEHEADRG